MGLIEEGQNSVPTFKTSDTGTSCDDCAGAIGSGDDGKVNWEAIFALQETDEPGQEGRHTGGA